MKGIDRKEINQEKDSKRIYAYFLFPYELRYDSFLKEEELYTQDIGTGPNCLR